MMNDLCSLSRGVYQRWSLAVLLLLVSSFAGAADRPNVLWLVAEDMSPNLGAYGDPDATTPHLDALARDGMKFTRAFSAAGVCAPSRSSLITGMYASTLGSQHMRSEVTLPAAVRTLPQLLRDAGYYCSNNFKEDYNFLPPADMWDDSSRTAHWRNRATDQPFFSVFNYMVTHESRLRRSDEDYAKLTQSLTADQRREASKVTLPAWLPEDQGVRREWARYHELITVMDRQVGRILADLEADGLAEDTLVFFFSDHGAGFPRAKQFVFESGLQVPLVVHVPEKWRDRIAFDAGAVESDLVSLIDLAPSVLAAVDLPVPAVMQGQSFWPRADASPRTTVHAIRDRMDERIDMNRTVRDERFKYHRNYRPDTPHFPWLDYMDRLESSQAFRRMAAEGTLPTGLAHFMAARKALEELYDLHNDPAELTNLAGDPAYGDVLQRLRATHFEWALNTRDTGYIPEQMLQDLAGGGSAYDYAQSESYAIERCIETVRLMERGEQAIPQLQAALRDEYPPVRFWAAVGLGLLGEAATTARAELAAVLADSHTEVALAAAEALLKQGEHAAAVDVLDQGLQDERLLVRLAAANVIDRAGERVRSLQPTIEFMAQLEPDGDLGLMVQWVLQHALRGLAATEVPLMTVGVGSIDITPQSAVRLHAFPRGPRVESVTAVTQPIHAKALAFGDDQAGPVLLVAANILGVSDTMVDTLASRLASEAGFSDRSKLTVAANHNHSAPALSSVAPFVFRTPPTDAQAREIADYEAWLMDQLVAVAKMALADRRPARVSYAKGELTFAMHRRLVEDGKWTGFGDNPSGPVDHDMPLLAVHEPDGTLRAAWMNYACHGVCWQKPSVHGDWMGVARTLIEATHPGAAAVITIGCAGDINPLDTYFRGQDPFTPGQLAAAEVERLLRTEMQSLGDVPITQLLRFDVPLQELPTAEEWAERTDWFGQSVHERLQRGETVADTLPFIGQTWTWGDDLAMVFMSGEVHVEYGLQLKERFDRDRLWVTAYTNASPGYIPTAAQLPEGGFEVDTARRNYGVPARLAPEAELHILDQMSTLIPASFRAGETAAADNEEWWKNSGHPKGKWWLTYPGYEPEAADKIWETVEIPPSPVRSPNDALAQFVVDEDFRVEIVAAEPLVVRPVFMRFDEAGRLWVVEMPGYMRDIDGTGENDPSGRIVVLEDRDGDGQMDHATPFLEGLVMPRTLALVQGGALVVEPPNIWLARDHDGDLVADEKILVADDYGVAGNPEHSANGLLPALDNWMYSAKSAVRYQLRGDELVAEPTMFRGQWGISQDDLGRLFYNYNASPLHADLLSAEYLVKADEVNLSVKRNVRGAMLVNESLVEDKSVHPVRVTPLVTLGASDLRPDGTLKQFTAASSPFIYRGDLFPSAMHGDAFVADPIGNLIKWFDLSTAGLAMTAAPALAEREVLASKDERFRPVFLESGPDGALYIADMYTGIVEHKLYVTEYLRKQVLGREIGNFSPTGRIYRLVPKSSETTSHPRLDQATGSELVAALDSANGWTRDTAQRLLVQYQQTDQVPALQAQARDGSTALGRLHALWTLEGLAALDTEVIAAGLRDGDGRVRAAAVRLSERLDASGWGRVAAAIMALITDPEQPVRAQAVLTLGQVDHELAWSALLDAAHHLDEWWVSSALAAGLRGREVAFLEAWEASDLAWPQSNYRVKLAEQLGFNVMARGRPDMIEAWLTWTSQHGMDHWMVTASLQGAASYEHIGDPRKLSAKPGLLAKLPDGSPPDAAAWIEALAGQLTWPGDLREGEAALAARNPEEERLFKIGEQQYALMCAACHQPNGMGLTGVAPPLAGSEWVVESERVPVEIILHGLKGPIEVKGERWDMLMPGLGMVFDDDQVAGITSYIRQTWGNRATSVSTETVAKIRAASANRKQPYTGEELKALPAADSIGQN